MGTMATTPAPVCISGVPPTLENDLTGETRVCHRPRSIRPCAGRRILPHSFAPARSGNEDLPVSGTAEAHERGHYHGLVGRRECGCGVEGVDSSWGSTHRGRASRAPQRSCRATPRAPCWSAADADGDAGAAGDEGKSNIDPSLADGARARNAGELSIQRLEGGVGIDAEIVGELPACLAATPVSEATVPSRFGSVAF